MAWANTCGNTLHRRMEAAPTLRLAGRQYVRKKPQTWGELRAVPWLRNLLHAYSVREMVSGGGRSSQGFSPG